MSTIPVPGGQLAYDRSGEGPPACLAHQYGAVGAHTVLGEALAAHFTCYAVNPRGLGGSSEPRDKADLTMEAAADDLEAARVALGLPPWVIVGASTGGMVAIMHALRNPTAVAGLILICTAASHRFVRGSLWDPAHPCAAEVARLNAGLASGAPAATTEWLTGIRRLSFADPTQAPPPAPLAAAPAGQTTGFSLERMMAFVRGLPDFDLESDLGRIAVPTLVIAGRYDPQCPWENGKRIADAVPQARFVLFEHSGHFPYLEEADGFRAALWAFVAETGLAGPRPVAWQRPD